MRHKKKHMFMRYLLIILLIFILIKIIYNKQGGKNILKILAQPENTIKSIKKEKVLDLDKVDDMGYVSDGFIIKRDDKLIKYSSLGDKIWTKDLVLTNCGVHFGKTNIYLYDNKGYIQYLNPNGDIIRELNLNEEIKNIKSEFGEILVYTIDNNDRGNFYIINKKGEIFEKNTQRDNDILTYTISKDHEIYGLGTVDFKNHDLKSSFKTYMKGNKLVYKKDFPGEMILYSKFIDTYRVIIMTDKNIYLLNDFEGNTLWKKEYRIIKDIDLHMNKIGLLYGNRIEKMSSDGEMDDRSFVEDYYERILSLDGINIVYGEDKLLALGSGKKILELEAVGNIKRVVKGKNKFAVIYKDRVELYRLYE